MKTNKMMRIASVLLVAVLLSTCVISGTFAKYTSTATATSTAKVAKWDVSVESTKLDSVTKTFTFDLFETIVDTVDDNEDDDVAEGHIAPGTKGVYELEITNTSEVAVNYTVEIDAPDAFDDIITFSASPASGTLNMTNNKTVAVAVSWTWPYQGNDANDLELGVAGLENYAVTVTVTVTQAD